jgi:hypothetical protein
MLGRSCLCTLRGWCSLPRANRSSHWQLNSFVVFARIGLMPAVKVSLHTRRVKCTSGCHLRCTACASQLRLTSVPVPHTRGARAGAPGDAPDSESAW